MRKIEGECRADCFVMSVIFNSISYVELSSKRIITYFQETIEIVNSTPNIISNIVQIKLNSNFYISCSWKKYGFSLFNAVFTKTRM